MMTQACTLIFCGSDACWGNQQMHGTDISSISHQKIELVTRHEQSAIVFPQVTKR